jgi:hypothetical protein
VSEPSSRGSEVPTDFPSVASGGEASAGYARTLLASVDEALKSLRADMRDGRSDIRSMSEHIRSEATARQSEFRFLIGAFAAGFVILAGMLIFGYFRLSDRIEALSSSSVRVETRLDDLAQRLPPAAQTPAHR